MHDQIFEARVGEAFALAMEVAGRSKVPFDVRKDIAQITVIESCDKLTTEVWQETISHHALQVTKRIVKEYKEHEAMKDTYITNTAVDRVNEESRELLMEVVGNALSSREWQVVHRRVWQEKGFDELGYEIGMSKQGVHKAYHKSIGKLRQALAVEGIDENNWKRWYYGGKL